MFTFPTFWEGLCVLCLRVLRKMNVVKWVLTPSKFLELSEASRLLQVVRGKAVDARNRGCSVAVRDWFVVELGLGSGLRVSEMAQLNCGDLYVEPGSCGLLVRKGKGGKPRFVFFNQVLRDVCISFLHWKESVGESVESVAPLLLSSVTQGHFSSRALQKSFKRSALRAGLSGRYSIHCLRHTYACELYRVSGHNLRLVQKQLGHSSIKTTEVYADVVEGEIRDVVENLFANKGVR
jgi:site-specific recombinase XerD